MKISIIVLIFPIITFSCANRKLEQGTNNLEYIYVSRKGSMDTIYRELLNHNITDSIHNISYKTLWNDDEFKQTFEFPRSKNKTQNNIQLLDEKVIEFEGTDYRIYKYLLDDPSADDEEMFYFYSPKYGIIIDKSAWWGNYDKLTNYGTDEDNRIIYYLAEMITNDDKKFFTNRK